MGLSAPFPAQDPSAENSSQKNDPVLQAQITGSQVHFAECHNGMDHSV
jgi:hypothetical protein